MRIQVVFKTTPILVPCGDGKLTVGELIEKAIVRFKKLGNRVRVGTERCLSCGSGRVAQVLQSAYCTTVYMWVVPLPILCTQRFASRAHYGLKRGVTPRLHLCCYRLPCTYVLCVCL